MPLPEDFAEQALYTEDHWFVHDLVELDVQNHRIVALMDTRRIGTAVRAQNAWPLHHKHLPGAVAIQVTGTLGNLHAVYCQGLKLTEGWVGYGTHLKKARFPTMGEIGPPVVLNVEATRRRNIRGTWFFDYSFRFEQDGRCVFESEQIAAWTRSDHRGPLPTLEMQ